MEMKEIPQPYDQLPDYRTLSRKLGKLKNWDSRTTLSTMKETLIDCGLNYPCTTKAQFRQIHATAVDIIESSLPDKKIDYYCKYFYTLCPTPYGRKDTLITSLHPDIMDHFGSERARLAGEMVWKEISDRFLEYLDYEKEHQMTDSLPYHIYQDAVRATRAWTAMRFINLSGRESTIHFTQDSSTWRRDIIIQWRKAIDDPIWSKCDLPRYFDWNRGFQSDLFKLEGSETNAYEYPDD